MHGLRNRELLERKDGNFSSLFLLRRTLDFDFLVCERRSLLRKGLIFLLDSLFHFFVERLNWMVGGGGVALELFDVCSLA